MEIYIDCRTRTMLPERFEDIIKTTVEQTLILSEVSGEYEISVAVVDNEEIKAINKHFRNIDNETDVLSFPLIDFSDVPDMQKAEYEIKDGALTALGDIIISAERAFLQAEQYGHSPEREFGFLTAHGMLHLLGYDHMTPGDEKIMFSLQEKIMSAMGLER